jgi:serine/threonine-protein kinase
MDFGIAKASTDQRLTMTGTTMGSLYYMSPEQIQGAAHIDSRADLYSVGVSLYELVTGKRPFDGDSQFAIMSAHLEKTPVPPVEVDPRLPQALNDAILMSVAKDPAMRFQTAGAFRAALGSIIPAAQAESAGAPILQSAPRPAAPVITQPQAPVPAAPFQPIPAVPVAMAPAKPKGRRILWMAMGALAAALGAISVVEFGPWKNTKAQTPTSPPQVSQTTPAQPPAALPAATQPQPAAASSAPSATEGKVGPPPNQASPMQAIAKVKPSAVRPASTPGDTAAVMQPPQIQAAVPPPVQQPVQRPPAQPAEVQPAAPSRAEMQAARERYAQLDARAGGIRSSLQSLQRSQAASGLNLSSRFTEPVSLMESYMRGASDALHASDAASAKDLMDKAERQVEILEKLLNR